jgi:predicted amino acid dehydrogenase
LAKFAFLVHPLTQLQSGVVGVRRFRVGMILGRSGKGAEAGKICDLSVDGVVHGEIISVPWSPKELLEDQDGAVDAMVRAVEGLHGVTAIGLGSLLAVVGSRGEALSSRVSVPVTTGAAATAWAALGNAEVVAKTRGCDKISVLGFGGAVGRVVAEGLSARGFEVIAGGVGKRLEREAAKIGIELMTPAAAAGASQVVVGASTTGGILESNVLQEGAVLLDVALPPTLRPGKLPLGAKVLLGEAVTLPDGWRRGFWGSLYHWLSGYGSDQIFACLAEPLVMSVTGRSTPFSLGRRVSLADVEEFSEAVTCLGLAPRLPEGWNVS